MKIDFFKNFLFLIKELFLILSQDLYQVWKRAICKFFFFWKIGKKGNRIIASIKLIVRMLYNEFYF